jgi:hypothetical protein
MEALIILKVLPLFYERNSVNVVMIIAVGLKVLTPLALLLIQSTWLLTRA